MCHTTQEDVDHLAYLRQRQREMFPRDGRLLEYTREAPLTVTIGELLTKVVN
jgi:hypothetical protein